MSSFFFTNNDDVAPMSWKETPHCHVYEFELPGLSKDDVKLDYHHNTRALHVSGERCEKAQQQSDDRWHLLERPRSFSRKVLLPENVNVDGISASMRDGVLVVTVPKDEEATEKKKESKKVVEIFGDSDEEEKGAHKGLGRFVCCRA